MAKNGPITKEDAERLCGILQKPWVGQRIRLVRQGSWDLVEDALQEAALRISAAVCKADRLPPSFFRADVPEKERVFRLARDVASSMARSAARRRAHEIVGGVNADLVVGAATRLAEEKLDAPSLAVLAPAEKALHAKARKSRGRRQEALRLLADNPMLIETHNREARPLLQSLLATSGFRTLKHLESELSQARKVARAALADV